MRNVIQKKNNMISHLKNTFLSSLKEYIPHEKSYTILLVCICLSLFLFLSPQKALMLISLDETPERLFLIKWMLPPWVMLLGLILVYVLSVRYYRSSRNLNHFVFDQKITLSVGEYFDIPTGGEYPLKVELKKISKEKMPPAEICIPYSKDNDVLTETATLTFFPVFMYPGRCVKKVEEYVSGSNEETFILPKYKFPEEDTSVFFFNVTNSTRGAAFFRCHIQHINAIKNEVELHVYSLWIDRKKYKNV